MSVPSAVDENVPDLKTKPKRGYIIPEAVNFDKDLYERMSKSAMEHLIKEIIVPRQDGTAFEVKAGQVIRFKVIEGSQVGDVNIWNLHDFRERLFTGKTRQIHRTHLTKHDRLWSNFPFLRPLATITQDSLAHYGLDEFGAGVHDVIGTRCDPYIQILQHGKEWKSCHRTLEKVIEPWGLTEFDVHDVFNIFMCTGFTREAGEYFVRGSPARAGDYIEILAEMDLLVALSACPYGDVSQIMGEMVPEEMCYPMGVDVGQPDESLMKEWRSKTQHKN